MGNVKLNTLNGSVTLIPEDGQSNVNITIPRTGFGKVLQMQMVKTNSRMSINTQTFTPITGLSIGFTPLKATSKIIIESVIYSSNTHVTSFGLLKNGVSVVSGMSNTNETASLVTVYDEGIGAGTDSIYSQSFAWDEDAGSTTMRTYQVAGTSSWSSGTYVLYINDRGSQDMQSYSYIKVTEIAA